MLTFQRRHNHHDPGRDIYTDSNKDGTHISHAPICCKQRGHNRSTGLKCHWHVSRISHCFQIKYKIRKFKTTLIMQSQYYYPSKSCLLWKVLQKYQADIYDHTPTANRLSEIWSRYLKSYPYCKQFIRKFQIRIVIEIVPIFTILKQTHRCR